MHPEIVRIHNWLAGLSTGDIAYVLDTETYDVTPALVRRVHFGSCRDSDVLEVMDVSFVRHRGRSLDGRYVLWPWDPARHGIEGPPIRED